MRQSTSYKNSLKTSFSKAAKTYDTYSTVQRDVNKRLLGLIPKGSFGCVLEIGCGTGTFTKMFLEKREIRELVAVDLSTDMVMEAKRKIADKRDRPCHFVCCDGEELPFIPKNRFDLIVSSSCIHWFIDLENSLDTLSSMYLKKNGLIVCALFGKGTLDELRLVIKKTVDESILLPSDSFPNIRDVSHALGKNLRCLTMESYSISRNYPDLFNLLICLKRTGTAPKIARTGAYLSRKKIIEADRLYRKMYGSITASYEIILFSAAADPGP